MSTLTRNPNLREEDFYETALPDGPTHERDLADADLHAAEDALHEAPRVYCGRTVDELIPKIVAELGEDAIVIRHEKGLRGGFAGFFRRPFVEIEAERGTPRFDRYDEDDGALALPDAYAEDPSPPPPAGARSVADVDARHTALAHTIELPAQTPEDHPIHALVELPPVPPAPTHPEDTFAAALAFAEHAEPLVREGHQSTDEHSAEERLPLEPFVDAFPPDDALQIPLPNPTTSADATARPVSSGPVRDAIERTLLGYGVEEQLVREVIHAAAAHVLPLIGTGIRAAGACLPASVETSSSPDLPQAVRRALQQRIPVCPPLPAGSATIALVGSGGSGKSACCAALLDAYHLRSTVPAVCATLAPGLAPGGLEVTLPPYLHEPVPLEHPEAEHALQRAAEEGLLLLDTPPLSPADHASIRTLAAALERLEPDQVVLALPATLGAKPLTRLLEAYRPLGTNALAITHVDETDQLGVAVQVACAVGIAPAYLLEGAGYGWRLAPIDPVELAGRLLPPP
jgi:SRP54-type protein, GTPase domain